MTEASIVEVMPSNCRLVLPELRKVLMCIINGVKGDWECGGERDVVSDVMDSKFKQSPEGKGCAKTFCCFIKGSIKKLV